MRIPEFVTKNKLLTAGFIILAIITLIAIFAPLIAPYEPGQINVENALNAPNSHNLFGTDEIGRDILSRMIYGTRVSISVSIFAIGIATLIGLFLGCLAGFYGGAIDYFVMRFVDVVLCFCSLSLQVSRSLSLMSVFTLTRKFSPSLSLMPLCIFVSVTSLGLARHRAIRQ